MTRVVHLAVPLRHTAHVRVRRTREWLRVREVAELLRVTRQRVDQLIQEGRFATVVRESDVPKAPVLIAKHCAEAEAARELCACREERT